MVFDGSYGIWSGIPGFGEGWISSLGSLVGNYSASYLRLDSSHMSADNMLAPEGFDPYLELGGIGDWHDLCSLRLYRIVDNEKVLDEDNQLVFRCKSDSITRIDEHTQYYVFIGYQYPLAIKAVLRNRWNGDTEIQASNSIDTITHVSVEEWAKYSNLAGEGINHSSVGACYWTADNHEYVGLSNVSWWGFYRTGGFFNLSQNQLFGCYVDLTKLGYTIDYQPSDEDDPYVPPYEDYSGPGGGNGDHDKTSDIIGYPEDPSISATDAGFVTLYNPTLGQVQELAALINSQTIWDIFKNFFEHAQDYIAGLGIIPVTPTVGASKHPTFGNFIKIEDIAMPVITDQYTDVDCGSIQIKEFYGSAADYAPLTRIKIYLPYIGYRDLDTDEVMGHTVQVKYKVDVYNGNCIAFIMIDGSVQYMYNGNCMQQIPVSAISFDDVIRNSINMIATVGGTIASAAGTGTEPPQKERSEESTGQKEKSGNGPANIGSSIMSLMGSKPIVERSGALGSSLGLMSVQKPYLIKIVPRQSTPRNYNGLKGYPSNITSKLSALKGYVQIDRVHLQGIPGTVAELEEIIALLNGGVLI